MPSERRRTSAASQAQLTDIALDAMGSDKAPCPEIDGAILACRSLPVRVHLVGPEERIREELESRLTAFAELPIGVGAEPPTRRARAKSAIKNAARGNGRAPLYELPIEVVHASQWITMEDKAATALRAKRDSSMRVGCKMVREGKAAGFITAGNTGAAMAISKMVLGTIPGVDRPALATLVPTSTGSPCVFLDVGANVDSKPQNLVEFAVMGAEYARAVLGIENPRVGLLSVGEEEVKGNALTKETLPLLRATSLNFVGNVEGRDLFNGRVDVIVTDGFVGNVALKTMEGTGKLVRELLRESLQSTITAQVGALLSRSAFDDFKKRLDYSEYGGAPLLGINGACIVGHGSSNARAIYNAIRVTAQFATAGTTRHIEQAFANLPRPL